MKRTTGSLLGLGLTVALLAGCSATDGVSLTAIGPGTGPSTRSETFRLGAGDALGSIIFAGGQPDDLDRSPRQDRGSGYATVDQGERRPR